MEKITRNEYLRTTIDINNGCYYSIRLKDDENIIYNVWSKKENGKKVYFIIKDDKEIVLDDEVKKWYLSDVREYERYGI